MREDKRYRLRVEVTIVEDRYYWVDAKSKAEAKRMFKAGDWLDNEVSDTFHKKDVIRETLELRPGAWSHPTDFDWRLTTNN